MELLEEKRNSEIKTCVQIAKYFSIIANCTKDMNHVVLHSKIYWFANRSNNKMKGKRVV